MRTGEKGVYIPSRSVLRYGVLQRARAHTALIFAITTHKLTRDTQTRLACPRTLDISHQVDCGDDLMINEIRYEIDIRRGYRKHRRSSPVQSAARIERVSSMGMCVCPSQFNNWSTYYMYIKKIYIYNITFICSNLSVYMYALVRVYAPTYIKARKLVEFQPVSLILASDAPSQLP